MTADVVRVQLIDAPEENRTTATLLAALAARLAGLGFVSGATAIGSFVAGFAALGAQVGCTADGARMRYALERHRAAANGNRLWEVLRIGDWTAAAAPVPILDQLRNDIALVLSPDLDEALALMPMPAAGSEEAAGGEGQPPVFVDFVLGLWAFSREFAAAFEQIIGPTAPPAGFVEPGKDDPGRSGASWLR